MRNCLVLLIAVISFSGSFCFSACPVGDIDGNCSVGIGDLAALADSWLETAVGGANLDGVGIVDMSDLSILAGHWGDTGYRLVINELMADNTATIEDPDEAGEYPDWIELYNYGATPIDLGGMYLKDDSTTWQIPSNAPAQTTVEPGGYLLFWADGDTEQGPLHTSFKLGASGDEVGLLAPDGSVIDDKVFGNLDADQSYGRFPNGGPGWQKFDNAAATPGSSNGGESADAGIVINEIMYNPGHDEAAYEPEPFALEYIELYNTGTSPVNLGGWRLVDGVDFQVPADTMIAANGYMVIAADTAAFSQAYPTVTNVVGGWVGKLNNQGERITLVNAVGTVIDTVHYYDEGQWAQRILGPMEYYHRGWEWSNAHDGEGRSLELVSTSMSNEYGQNWQASQVNNGTPGRANSYTVSDLAPIILKVKQTPIIPASDQPVTVTAEVTDETVATVSMTLHWRIDTSTYVQSQYPVYDAASYTTLTMYDDGLHGDKQAGDGIYGATIPAQADGKVIEFFVEASDAAANTRTWPAACDVDGQLQQVANCLYQVDDSFNPAALTGDGTKPVYYLIMTESERGRLADIGKEDSGDNNERYSRVQMNGTFISVIGPDIQYRYGVGYRDRGEGSSGTPPNNVHINFRTDDPYDGTTKINCNSKYTFLQVAGSQLFRSAGFDAFETRPVQLYVNGTEPALTDLSRTYGYYAAFRPYSSEWLDQFMLTDPNDVAGNLYKASSTGWHADFTYRGTDPASYVSAGYSKNNNSSENDWSDLFQLTTVMSNTSAPDYVQQIKNIIDVRQWMRWFAMNTIIGNNENGLATSCGDDYCMYRNGNTNKFQLLIYDLDTILHVAHEVPPLNRSIFYQVDRTSADVPLLDHIFQQPEFVQMYYEELWDLIHTFFPAEKFNPLVDQIVKGWVPDSMLADMKDNTAQRVQQALLQIPLTFSIQSSLSVVNGYHQTTSNTTQLTGKANAVTTHSVYVNGVAASWNPIDGDWSAANIALLPGLNRIIVETYGTADNSGPVLETGTIDVWYNDGSESTISGTLAANQTLTVAAGPWHVTGDIVIPAGVTLTIQAGTTLFFDTSAGITVNGALVAEGTKFAHIHMAPNPGSATRWDGLALRSTPTESRLVYVDMEYGDGQGDSMIVNAARIFMNYMTFTSTNDTTPFMELTHPQAIIQNCIFPSIGGTEPLHGSGLSGSEYLIFNGCTFGKTTGYNDILDFTGGKRPGPIIQMYNNFFPGGGDDALDFDGTDGHVEGNIFYAFVNGYDGNVDHTTSNAVATDFGSDIVIARNLFVGGDHHVLLKNDVAITAQNNTFVGATMASINFGEPARGVDPGAGAYLENSIFFDNARIFYNIFDNPAYPGYGPDPMPSIYNTIVPTEWQSLGTGNMDADPVFADSAGGDYSLYPGSPAIGTGTNGLDMGYKVPAGASVSGEPAPVSHTTDAALSVGGPGIVSYRWRLVDDGTPGVWSSEIPLPIAAGNYDLGTLSLTGLVNGHTYRVDVVGKNSAGLWQGQPFSDTDFVASGNPEGNSSHTWTVDTTSQVLVINEVLAANTTIEHEGTYPDMIELYYDGATPIDLGGYSLTDNKDLPDKFVFAAGTMMNPGDYLVVYADAVNGTSGIHTGFSIDSNGDSVTLLNAQGAVVDTIKFGIQLKDLSIGRVRYDRQWALTEPTLGSANKIAPTGDWRNLKINEWLANENILFTQDLLEIFNPSSCPVDMGGLYLTDNPAGQPDKDQFRPLSFIAGKGFTVLVADGDGKAGANHLNFKLNSQQGTIALFDPDLNLLDQVAYYQQKTDVSQGRMPDGGPDVGYFDLPTPGAVNTNVDTTVTQQDLIGMEDVWSYNQTGTDLGTSWRDAGYNDAGWPTGAALLYVESSSLPAPKNTPLTLGKTTYYFRRHFTFNGDPASIDHLAFTTVIDDGAVIYINGVEALRIGMTGTITYSTYTSRTIDNATLENFEVPAGALVDGDNVIAVEVHQTNATSSDIVFGLELQAVSVTTSVDDIYVNSRNVLNGLRITEIMYNPAADPNSEFIELQNISDTAIQLEGVRFTSGVDFTFPQMTLDPGQYTVVVADQGVFESRYGTQINIAGQYIGKLSNGNELIILQLAEPLDAAVMRFEYKDGWYPTTDGGGYSLVITDPAGPLDSWQQAESWRPSTVAGGSPGRDDVATVIINEVLAHSHDTLPDWIELYNPTNAPVNVGGWYLSDNADNLMKYRIAADTVIESDDYLVLYENDHFNNPADSGSLVQFALSENGDQVYLSSAENGTLTGYTTEVSFGASETGVSFGHYEKSDGTSAFVSMSSNTPGQANAAPKVGPVVISEIMYNPPAGGSYPQDDYEYIELHNVTGAPVTLQTYDTEMGLTLGWRFTDGIDFTFPLNTTIPANGYLIVARNPLAFAERYGSANGSAVMGPFENDTKLSNSGERLQLSLPGDTDLLGIRYYVQVDSVLYDDGLPWPASPDGDGQSLGRISDTGYGDDVINWQAQTPSPGM